MSIKQEEEFIMLANQEMIDRARQGLLPFTLYTNDKYQVNWHHRFMCDKLDKFLRREIQYLMFFTPPRHGKSELVSRRLPAMIHGLYPDDEIITASYSASLANSMCRDVQTIMDSDEYRTLFPDSLITRLGSKTGYERTASFHRLFSKYFDEKSGVEKTKQRGSYTTGGILGPFTGKGANWLVIDDPYKNQQDAESEAIVKQVINQYRSSLMTRLEAKSSVLITMTRWSERDLAGELKKEMDKDPDAIQWDIVDFPAVKENHNNPDDPREIDEPLWPEKKDKKSLDLIKRSLGIRVWTSLYQQRPTNFDGGIVKREHFRYWRELPKVIDEMIQSWDCAFAKTEDSDFVVGQVWARAQQDYYLIDQFRSRMSFTETCTAIKNMTAKHPRAYTKLIEKKANGDAVIDSLNSVVGGMITYNPKVSKEARFNAASPAFESGNVYVPHPDYNSWVNEYIDELCAFPLGSDDDQVDATSQALIRFREKGGYSLDRMNTR